MASELLNVAVVGLGFGSAFVPIYQRHPNVAQVAICDANEAQLKRVGDRFGVEIRYSRIEHLLEDTRIDAVHLLTPVPLHVEQTLAVLNSGRHCACAVPIATDLDGIQRIIEAQTASRKNYMMMETGAYDRAYFYVDELIASGEIGELTFLRGDYFQDLEGGYPAYWQAQPPMHYTTHIVGPLLGLAKTRATRVIGLGSGRLKSHIQIPGENRFPLQSAIFELADSTAVMQITKSWFQIARSYTEAFSVYGDAKGFEWQQLYDEEPVLYTLEPPEPGRRGRHVAAERVSPPFRPDLLPTEIAEFAAGDHGGSHPHLVHEFVRSIVEGRPSRIRAEVAAEWTAPGICANESALAGGAAVQVPSFR